MPANDHLLKMKTIMIMVLLGGAAFIPNIPSLMGDTLLIVGVFVTLGIWLTQMIMAGKISTRSTPLDNPLILAILVGLIGFFKSPHILESLMALLKFLSLLIFGLILLNYENRNALVKYIYRLVIWLSFILAVLSIYEYFFGLWGIPAGGRVLSTFPNPNHFAGFLACGLTFICYQLFYGTMEIKDRFLWVLVIAVELTALWLTKSKGGALSLGIGIFVILFIYRRKWSYIFAGLAAAALVLIVMTPLRGVVFSREIHDPYTFEKVALYKETINYIKDYPVLGTGLETFRYYFPRYKTMPGLRSAPYVHNELLNIWTDFGLPGVALFIWILVVYFRNASRQVGIEKNSAMIGFVAVVTGILAQSMIEFNLHSPGLAMIFMALLAVTVSLAKEKQGKIAEIKVVRRNLWLGLSWGLVILLAAILSMPVIAANQEEQGDMAANNLNYLESMVYYDRAMKFNPIDPEIMSKAGITFYNEGMQLKDGIFIWAAGHYLEKAAHLQSLNPFRYRTLADFYWHIGQKEKAIEVYRQVLVLAPNVEEFRKEVAHLQGAKKP